MRCTSLLLIALASCSSSRAPAPEPPANQRDEPRIAKSEACKQLLAHLIDLEFARAGSSAPPDQIADQKAAVAAAKSDEFLTVCLDKTPRAQIDCALAAADLDAVARCDEHAPQRGR